MMDLLRTGFFLLFILMNRHFFNVIISSQHRRRSSLFIVFVILENSQEIAFCMGLQEISSRFLVENLSFTKSLPAQYDIFLYLNY